MKTITRIDRILIIAPSWLGDATMSHSLIKNLSERFKPVTIDVFVSAALRAVFERMPEIGQIIANPLEHGELKLATRWQIGQSLRSTNYDAAYVLPNSFKSALIPFFARIPKRIGYTGEARVGLLNQRVVLNKTSFPLLADQYLQLAKKENTSCIKSSEYPHLSVEKNEARHALRKYGLNNTNPYVCLCPGAEYGAAKRWPIKHFAELADQISHCDLHPVILGNSKDTEIGRAIDKYSKYSTTDLTSKTSLKEAIHIISGARCVVTNDSGLMHIAAALKTPLIALFGSSSPQYTPPLSINSKIISLTMSCSPCFERTCPLGHTKCLTEIEPGAVMKEVLKLTERI